MPHATERHGSMVLCDIFSIYLSRRARNASSNSPLKSIPIRVARKSATSLRFLVASFLHSSHLGSGTTDEVFLLRELLARTLRHMMPVDEVQGDLYVLLDSLNLREEDAQWVASFPDSFVDRWADIFRPSKTSILASCNLLAMRATNIALARDFLRLGDDEHVTKSGFFDLPSLVERVVKNPDEFPQWELGGSNARPTPRSDDVAEERGSSRAWSSGFVC